jgi:ribosome-binding protein aMBF1 (putative translation factor)
MFKKIVQEIIKSGLSETQIADLVKADQSSINRIKNGKQEPGGELAMALFELRKKRSRFLNNSILYTSDAADE